MAVELDVLPLLGARSPTPVGPTREGWTSPSFRPPLYQRLEVDSIFVQSVRLARAALRRNCPAEWSFIITVLVTTMNSATPTWRVVFICP